MGAEVWAAWVGGVGLPIVLGALGYVNYRIGEAENKAQGALDELAAYKLQVAEKYASITYLKDVEVRIMAGLDKLQRSFDGFVEGYHASRMDSGGR